MGETESTFDLAVRSSLGPPKSIEICGLTNKKAKKNWFLKFPSDPANFNFPSQSQWSISWKFQIVRRNRVRTTKLLGHTTWANTSPYQGQHYPRSRHSRSNEVKKCQFWLKCHFVKINRIPGLFKYSNWPVIVHDDLSHIRVGHYCQRSPKVMLGQQRECKI